MPVKAQAASAGIKQAREIEPCRLLLCFPPPPSPSPSASLFPFPSPSVCSPLTNLHLLISIQHIYELIPTLFSLCQDIPLSNLPHPLAMRAFSSTDFF